MYVLTDLFYDDPTYNFDNDPDPYGVTRAFWPGWRNDTYDWSYNGVWQHVVLEQPFTTSTGDIEVRLLLHDKAPGAQAVAWDNLTLTLDEPLGACCLPNATCVEVTQSECVNDLNGRFQGVFTTCDDPELTCCPDPFADIDTDGDVDHSDFALMQLCFTGPNAAGDPLPAGCECVDHNTDGAIDSADMGYFSQCVSGPYVDADLTCDD
jgi:hypothetical protein